MIDNNLFTDSLNISESKLFVDYSDLGLVYPATSSARKTFFKTFIDSSANLSSMLRLSGLISA